ncbi:Membrane protein, putative [Shewanella piezotolerans WP3]|uniref:Membrane protein, putative n=1 Tax=Shewanella piezotolerans (strain WP3 / JCM 13877) TaxID=225849 RepID=B8CU82_SHEPW|nr:MAPEG family protein [Shewanella piezotolerans]ACJ30938.1 Membrane protein, putative [Shewanella piezotolerans WP3]
MTIPLWCLGIVALLPYLLAGLGGYYKKTQLGYIDSENPREQFKLLTGNAIRVLPAQQNAWEALGLFTATVLIAHLAGANAELSAFASIIFVLTRLVHPFLYIGNYAKARSAIVILGLLSCIFMILLASMA